MSEENENLLGAPEAAEEAQPGHNAKQALVTYLERIETLEEEKKGLAEDVKLVKQEAVAQGFDKKTMQEMLKLRAMDKEKLLEQEHLRDTYIDALDLL